MYAMVPSLNKAWAGVMSLLGDRVFQIHNRNKIKGRRGRKQLRDYKGKELGTKIRTIENRGEDPCNLQKLDTLVSYVRTPRNPL